MGRPTSSYLFEVSIKPELLWLRAADDPMTFRVALDVLSHVHVIRWSR